MFKTVLLKLSSDLTFVQSIKRDFLFFEEGKLSGLKRVNP